jgi:hypothetical protein
MLIKSALISLLSFNCLASDIPQRMSETSLARDQVHQIFVAFGRSTIIEFPCNIMSYSTGPTKDIDAHLNDKKLQVLEVWLAKNDGEPAGLKVLCKDEVFAFDITPSRSIHQDFIRVKAATGRLSSQINLKGAKIIATSTTGNLERHEYKVVRTIMSSQTTTKELNK